MNLGQAISRGSFAVERTESTSSGLTLEELKRQGAASVRVHVAPLTQAPQEEEETRAAKVQSGVDRVCDAIRGAGRPLSSRELKSVSGLSDGALSWVVRKLIARGSITRSGDPRHYLFGLPDMK